MQVGRDAGQRLGPGPEAEVVRDHEPLSRRKVRHRLGHRLVLHMRQRTGLGIGRSRVRDDDAERCSVSPGLVEGTDLEGQARSFRWSR